jgi:hypothetical protein
LVANNGKEKNHAVIPGRKTKVVLLDANGEQADSISVPQMNSEAIQENSSCLWGC